MLVTEESRILIIGALYRRQALAIYRVESANRMAISSMSNRIFDDDDASTATDIRTLASGNPTAGSESEVGEISPMKVRRRDTDAAK